MSFVNLMLLIWHELGWGGVNLCFKGKAKKDKNLDNIYTKGEGTGKLSRSRGGDVQREGV